MLLCASAPHPRRLCAFPVMETSGAGREADDGSAGGLWKLQSSMTSKEDMLKTEGCVELSEERKKGGAVHQQSGAVWLFVKGAKDGISGIKRGRRPAEEATGESWPFK